jgi:hypothetical protein
VTLNRSDVVPEPLGDLVDRYPCARKETRERMPHDVRRHPWGPLGSLHKGRTVCQSQRYTLFRREAISG